MAIFVSKTMGRFIGRHPRLILLFGLLLVLAAARWDRDLSARLSLSPGLDSPDSESSIAQSWLKLHLGHDETPVIVLFRARQAGLPESDIRDAVEHALEGIDHDPDVRNVTSHFTSGDERLMSSDGRMTYAVVSLARGSDEGLAAFKRLRHSLVSDRLDILLGGELATYVDVRDRLHNDIWRAELLSFAILAVFLIWVFGSAVAALLPLLTGAASIVLSYAALKICTEFLDVGVYAVNVVSMLGLGLAIDYSLFIVSRYREELVLRPPDSALRITLSTAGRTVLFSGLTVAASLLCLIMLPQRFFQDMGLAGAIAVASAMLSAILLLPALLHLLGRRVNALAVPWLGHHAEHIAEGGTWFRIGSFVIRHARSVLPVSLLVLGGMAWPVYKLSIGPADSRILPVDAESRQVAEALDTQFAPAELQPMIVVVRTQGPASSPAGLAAIDQLSRSIAAQPNVTRVRSLTRIDPMLNLSDYQLLYSYPEQFPLASTTLHQFAHGSYSMIIVNYFMDPTSSEARNLAARIRALPRPDGLLDVRVGGYPAFHLDYLAALKKGVPYVFSAIVAINLLLLFMMLGSVVVPLKAVLANLFSLSATFGALVWIFQLGHLAGPLNFTPQANLDGTLLVLIFAMAFGLAIDYEMFLLARVREACQSGLEFCDAVTEGVRRSGPVITGAALLICVVLASFATGSVVSMKAMAVGLLVSIMADATLVRMLLVPATLKMLGRFCWWVPKPLATLHRHIGFQEGES